MSRSTIDNRPLINEPSREAVAALRGYSYQILQSVLAWINLPETEVLFLEGAEDFDHISANAAMAIQIKDTRGTGNVTLRTPGVLRAIDNYWTHKSRNTGRRVRFRYLTTSTIGIELGNPFGNDLSGIELWRSVKQNDASGRRATDLNMLRDFLLSQSSLSEALKKFLNNCSSSDFLSELVEPIDWDTGAASSADILTVIHDRLVTFGHMQQIPPRDAENAIGALHFHVWKVATTPRYEDRKLNQADFLRVFHDSTGIWMPKSKATQAIAKALDSQYIDSRHFVRDPAIDRLPLALQIAEPMIDRDSEAELLKDWSQPNRVIPISGPPSSGKSTIIRKHIIGLLEPPGHKINGKPISLLYVNLSKKRPWRAFNDSLRSSIDFSLGGMDRLLRVNDNEDDSDPIKSETDYLIQYILASHLHDRALVVILDNFSDIASTDAAVKELKIILDCEPFRHAVVLVETEAEMPVSSNRIIMPSLAAEPLTTEFATKLLVACDQTPEVAAGAINFFGGDATILYPGVLVKGAARYPVSLRRAGGKVTAEMLALAFLEQAWRVVEDVLGDLGCDQVDTNGATALHTLTVMSVLADLPFSKSMLETASLPYPPVDKLRELKWVIGNHHFQLAGLAREGLRTRASLILNDIDRRTELIDSIRRLFKVCKSSLSEIKRFHAALEDATRWLIRRVPNEMELRLLFAPELVQASGVDALSPFLPDEETALLPQLKLEAQRGDYDAAIANLILTIRVDNASGDGISDFLAGARRVIELSAEHRSLAAIQLQSVDAALYVGSRKYNRIKDVLDLRLSVHEILSRQADSVGTNDLRWAGSWTSWLLNIAELHTSLGEHRNAFVFIEEARHRLKRLFAARATAVDKSWLWWLRSRLNTLEERVTSDPEKRVRLLRQSVASARRSLELVPFELSRARFFIRAVRRLMSALSEDGTRKAVVDQALLTFENIFGPTDEWNIAIRAPFAALMRDEARRAWSIGYQQTRAREALDLLRHSVLGDGRAEILSNEGAGLVEVRTLAFLGQLDEADRRCDEVLRLWPTASAAWRLKLKLADRRSERLDLRDLALDATDSAGGKLSGELRKAIRRFKILLDETKTCDAAFGEVLLWTIGRQWAEEGSIVRRAARLALEAESKDFSHFARNEQEKRLTKVYKTRIASLNTLERRFGPFLELALARIRAEAQFQRSIAIGRREAVKTTSVLKLFDWASRLWPDNYTLTFQLAEYYRYIWDFPRAIVNFRKVMEGTPNGDMRRQTIVRLAQTLHVTGTYSKVVEFPDGSRISAVDLLREANTLILSVSGFRDVAREVGLLRDHLALELNEEVDWSALNYMFDLLIRDVDGFPNVMIENLDELLATAPSDIPAHLHEVTRQHFVDPEVLGLMGMLYLRRCEKVRSVEPLRDFARAYALFNACSLLERSWYDFEFPVTSFRRGRAILMAARLTHNTNPFERASFEGRRDQLSLAVSRLQSAADRSSGDFRDLVLGYVKMAQQLKLELGSE